MKERISNIPVLPVLEHSQPPNSCDYSTVADPRFAEFFSSHVEPVINNKKWPRRYDLLQLAPYDIEGLKLVNAEKVKSAVSRYGIIERTKALREYLHRTYSILCVSPDQYRAFVSLIRTYQEMESPDESEDVWWQVADRARERWGDNPVAEQIRKKEGEAERSKPVASGVDWGKVFPDPTGEPAIVVENNEKQKSGQEGEIVDPQLRQVMAEFEEALKTVPFWNVKIANIGRLFQLPEEKFTKLYRYIQRSRVIRFLERDGQEVNDSRDNEGIARLYISPQKARALKVVLSEILPHISENSLTMKIPWPEVIAQARHKMGGSEIASEIHDPDFGPVEVFRDTILSKKEKKKPAEKRKNAAQEESRIAERLERYSASDLYDWTRLETITEEILDGFIPAVPNVSDEISFQHLAKSGVAISRGTANGFLYIHASMTRDPKKPFHFQIEGEDVVTYKQLRSAMITTKDTLRALKARGFIQQGTLSEALRKVQQRDMRQAER